MNNKIDLNSKLNFQEYQEQKTILESYPQYLIVELTRSCNLTCPMCRDSNRDFAWHKMSMEIFSKIDKELFDKAKLIDLRGWGESLILDNIVDIIEVVAQKGAMIRFVTNLSYRRKDVFEALAKYNCKIAISLDSVDEKILNEIRGGASLKIINENLKLLTVLYQQYQGSTDQLSFLTAVQYPALNTLYQIVPFAANYSIKEIILFPVDINSESILSLENKDVEVNAMLLKVSSLSKEYNINVIAGSKLGCLPTNPLNMPTCIHPWAYCYIAYNGKIGFCDHLIGPAFDDVLMGDLYLNSFREIWNSIQWQDLRSNHLTKRNKSIHNFERCSWCYQNKYVDFEDMFDKSLVKRKIN
jgi:radical SAM protein with 4Fe4S-binding SPASM domain